MNIEDSFFAVDKICLNFALLADLIGDVDAGLLPAFSDGASVTRSSSSSILPLGKLKPTEANA